MLNTEEAKTEPVHLLILVRIAGLFNPGEIPDPTMENWLKNMEPWETPAKGTKRTAELN